MVTNAAIKFSPKSEVGDTIPIHDHINLPGSSYSQNPLKGPSDRLSGFHFPAMSDSFDHRMKWKALGTWKQMGEIAGAMYDVGGSQPCLPGKLGANTVDMSPVFEVTVADAQIFQSLAHQEQGHC